MRPRGFTELLLAFIVVYMPYQTHYSLVLPVKGLNIMNMLFLVALAAVLLGGRSRRAPGAATAPTPLKGAFLLVFAALAFAFLVAVLRDSSSLADDLTGFKNNVFYMLFYFLFYHAVRDVRAIRLLFAAILFTTFLVSLQAVRQGLDYGIANFSHTHRASGPFATTYVGANLAAAYFVIFVPLHFVGILVCRSRPWLRLALLPAVLLGVFGALLTYSRQAYFLLPAQFLAQALRRNLVIGVLLAAAVASYAAWAPEAVIDRIEMTEQKGEGDETQLDTSTESRFLLWAGAAEIIAANPWGIGLRRFASEIGAYVPGLQKFDAHNAFVLVAAECGIQGLLAVMVLLGGMFRLAWRVGRIDRSESTQWLAQGFMLATVGAVGSNLFGSRIFDGPVMGNYWILAALAARYLTLHESARPAPAGATRIA